MSEAPETWPLGYDVTCPSCGQSHEVDEVDLADEASHPYSLPDGTRMFNFDCPNCRTYNGVRYEDTSRDGKPPVSHEPAPASAPVDPPPGEPDAVGVTTEEVDPAYADGAHA